MSSERAVWFLQSQDGVGVELKGIPSTGPNENKSAAGGKEIHITAFKKLLIAVFGKTRIGSESKDGWSAKLPLYAFKCPKHGIQVTYPSGWQKTLQCPECVVELINKKPKKNRLPEKAKTMGGHSMRRLGSR